MCGRPTTIGPMLLALVGAITPSISLYAKPNPPTEDERATKRAALKLFQRGEARYHEGKFKEAAALLRGAYELDPAPILMFNVGRALESAGDLEGALDAYTQYLEVDPTALDRRVIEQRNAKLREQIAARKADEALLEGERKKLAQPKPIAVETAVAPPAVSIDPLPFILAGAGVANLIAGGVLHAMASSRQKSAAEEPTQQRASALSDDAHGIQTGANIALIMGGALAIGGGVWALLNLIGSSEPNPEPSGSPPGEGALTIYW